MEERGVWSAEASEDDVQSVTSSDSGVTSPRVVTHTQEVKVTHYTSTIKLVPVGSTTSRPQERRTEVPEYLKASTRPSLARTRPVEEVPNEPTGRESRSNSLRRPSGADSKIALLTKKFQAGEESSASSLRKFSISSPSINELGKAGGEKKLNVYGNNSAEDDLGDRKTEQLSRISSRFSQSQDRLNNTDSHSTTLVTQPRESVSQIGRVATLYLNKIDQGALSSERNINRIRSGSESSRRSSSGSTESPKGLGPRSPFTRPAGFQDRLQKFQSLDSQGLQQSPRSIKSQVYIDKGRGDIDVKSTILRHDILESNRFGSAKKPGYDLDGEVYDDDEQVSHHPVNSQVEFRVRLPQTIAERKLSEPSRGGPLKAIHPTERKKSEPSNAIDRHGSSNDVFHTLPNTDDNNLPLSQVAIPREGVLERGSNSSGSSPFFTGELENGQLSQLRKNAKHTIEPQDKSQATFQSNFNAKPRPFKPVDNEIEVESKQGHLELKTNDFNGKPRPFKSSVSRNEDIQSDSANGSINIGHQRDSNKIESPVNGNKSYQDKAPAEGRESAQARQILNKALQPRVTDQPSSAKDTLPSRGGKFQEVFFKFQLNEAAPEKANTPGLKLITSKGVIEKEQSPSVSATSRHITTTRPDSFSTRGSSRSESPVHSKGDQLETRALDFDPHVKRDIKINAIKVQSAAEVHSDGLPTRRRFHDTDDRAPNATNSRSSGISVVSRKIEDAKNSQLDTPEGPPTIPSLPPPRRRREASPEPSSSEEADLDEPNTPQDIIQSRETLNIRGPKNESKQVLQVHKWESPGSSSELSNAEDAQRDRSPVRVDSDGSVDSGVSSLGRNSSQEVQRKGKYDRSGAVHEAPAVRKQGIAKVAEVFEKSTVSKTVVNISSRNSGNSIQDRISKLTKTETVKTRSTEKPSLNGSQVPSWKKTVANRSKFETDVQTRSSRKEESETELTQLGYRRSLRSAQSGSSQEYPDSSQTDDSIQSSPLLPRSNSGRRHRTYSTESDSTVKSENTEGSLDLTQSEPVKEPYVPKPTSEVRKLEKEEELAPFSDETIERRHLNRIHKEAETDLYISNTVKKESPSESTSPPRQQSKITASSKEDSPTTSTKKKKVPTATLR